MKHISNAFKIRKSAERVRKDRLKTAKSSDVSRQTVGFGGGHIWLKMPARGRRAKGVFGVTQAATTDGGDPTYKLAEMIQAALTKPPRFGIVTVYDANGKPIATIDPHTRERKPIV